MKANDSNEVRRIASARAGPTNWSVLVVTFSPPLSMPWLRVLAPEPGSPASSTATCRPEAAKRAGRRQAAIPGADYQHIRMLRQRIVRRARRGGVPPIGAGLPIGVEGGVFHEPDSQSFQRFSVAARLASTQAPSIRASCASASGVATSSCRSDGLSSASAAWLVVA